MSSRRNAVDCCGDTWHRTVMQQGHGRWREGHVTSYCRNMERLTVSFHYGPRR